MTPDQSISPSPLPDSSIGRRVRNGTTVVLGYGVSNRPLVGLLTGLGARVCVYDQKPPEVLGEEAVRDAQTGVRFFSDWESLPTRDVSVVFRSPGFRPDLPYIRAATESGALLSSEMEWFLSVTPATVLGITGSDGKTTTSTLTARMLEAAGHQVFLGGNIGTPLLCQVPRMRPEDYVVLELSSFQLCSMGQAPLRSAITNLSPNHLNWHTGMEEYTQAKSRIYGPGCRYVVTNADNPITSALAPHIPKEAELVLFSSSGEPPAVLENGRAVSRRLWIREDVLVCREKNGDEIPLVPTRDILLPARHNWENIMTACGMVWGLASPDAMRQVARTFPGVEHRLERVRTLHGVTYYNSSIDSSPTRTAAALSAIRQPMVVICGGYDKHIPFAPLADALCRHARAVVLTGATAGAIDEALRFCPAFDPRVLTVVREPDFRSAVLRASSLARPGDAVLLSPACASFDAFANFAERGRVFKDIVRQLS